MNNEISKQFSIAREALEQCIRYISRSNFPFQPSPDAQVALEQAEFALEALIGQSPDPDSVPVPQNADQAELMAKLGMKWLQDNSPDRLKAPAQPVDERKAFEDAYRRRFNVPSDVYLRRFPDVDAAWEWWQAGRAALASNEAAPQEPVAWGVPNSRPTEKQPFMQLLHSLDGVQYPELLVPLYIAPASAAKGKCSECAWPDVSEFAAVIAQQKERIGKLEMQAASAEPITDEVRSAILEYYASLDNHQHGGIAQNKAFSKIQQALGMHWVQGASKQINKTATDDDRNWQCREDDPFAPPKSD
jgi:hypothetical protein